MIESMSHVGDEHVLASDVVVVGAGPAGIVTALELARRGRQVLLLESGEAKMDAELQNLSEAAVWDNERHAPLSIAVRRQLGGTSAIWGGRCVPYDPVDFVRRAVTGNASWPVSYEAISRYHQRACDWMVCGRAVFDSSEIDHLPAGMVPGLVPGDITTTSLERWSLPTDFGRVYRKELSAEPRIRVVLGLTCTEIVTAQHSAQADHLLCKTVSGGQVRVNAREFVIASGGLEGTRLLMSSKGPEGEMLGDRGDKLGRYYMAHLEGVVANIVFSTDPKQTIYGYERDIDGVYVRRRLGFTEKVQVEEGLPNIVSWIANPEIADASHQNGSLSFVYLALASRLGPKFAPEAQRRSLTGEKIPGTPYGGSYQSPTQAHLFNIAKSPFGTARFITKFGAGRFLSKRRAPGFFVYSSKNTYPLEYHGEHLPASESKVVRSRSVDVLGRPKLEVDLRFSSSDLDGVVRAHERWDRFLRSSNVGKLEYLYSDVKQSISDRAGGGFHQIGTTRMSQSPRDGVVDENLAVHGVKNVYVVSSSNFVTSGQANSTFLIVALAIRLADHLLSKG